MPIVRVDIGEPMMTQDNNLQSFEDWLERNAQTGATDDLEDRLASGSDPDQLFLADRLSDNSQSIEADPDSIDPATLNQLVAEICGIPSEALPSDGGAQLDVIFRADLFTQED
ncbi:MAG: hypothetical protein AAFY26_00695 [Cyanobacteria bacterium J06638_22]